MSFLLCIQTKQASFHLEYESRQINYLQSELTIWHVQKEKIYHKNKNNKYKKQRQKLIWEEWMREKTSQRNILLNYCFRRDKTFFFFFLLRVWWSQFWLISGGYFWKNLTIAMLGCFFISYLEEIKYLTCSCAKERMLPQYFPYIMTFKGFSDNICERGMYSTRENWEC